MSDPETTVPVEAQKINAEASVLMKQGLRLMDDRRPGAVSEALAYFDAALELRRRLPIDVIPVFRYGLAACWLNRADALVRLGSERIADAAIPAYDEGIRLLRGLSLGDDPRFPRRLAIAHQNRGLALQAQTQPVLAEAVAAFVQAIAVLEHDHAAPITDREHLLAVVWSNLASAQASSEGAEAESSARGAALRAIALVAEKEGHDADAAEVGLKARHVFCRTVAGRLSPGVAGDGPMPDDVHDATDVVDDGLELVRHWEQQGVTRFRHIAYDLFRFGARVYARYQPQFLNEFVLDNVDPARSSSDYVESAEIQSAAREALASRPYGPR